MKTIQNVLEVMRTQAEEAEQSQAQALKEREKAEKTCIIEALGDLWADLKPYATWAFEERPGNAFTSRMRIDAGSLELSPFVIEISPPNIGGRMTIKADGTNPLQLDRAGAEENLRKILFYANQRYLENKEAKRQDLIAQNLRRLNWKDRYTIDQARDILLELISLDPENIEAHEKAFAEYKEKRLDYERMVAKTYDEEQRLIGLGQEYQVDYMAQYADYYATLLENRRLFTEEAMSIITTHAYAFLYKVTHALVANDRGHEYVETETVWSIDEKPDKDGYWTVFQGRNLVHIRYTHVVSVEEVECPDPFADAPYTHFFYIPEIGLHAYLPAHLSDHEIAQFKQALGLQPLPEINIQRPDGLDEHTARQAEEHARQRVEAELGEAGDE